MPSCCPVTPYPTRDFRSETALTFFRKLSSLIFHPSAAEGKLPQRKAGLNLDEPSLRKVAVSS